ncbi:MAG: hypothetical protein ACM3OC_00385 [Deltaproteobacteria bacterium]
MFETTFKTSMGVSKVLGGISGDYFSFFCEKCGSRIRVRYVGHENLTPCFESVCKCGEKTRFKSIISDLPNGQAGSKTD